MCGIVGIFDYGDTLGRISSEILVKMTDTISHRGPDDDGIFLSDDGRVGLGFRRLSIIDLSPAGHQPMSNGDGTIWIVFNGEIYNHEVLRRELKRKGYVYKSRTDTETILYAYEEYGIDFVSRLYGMFAIAIWDAREDKVILVRDRIGIKPLYYTQKNGTLIFASEIKSILQHPMVSAELDKQSLYDYLSFATSLPSKTFFSGISKISPGTYAVIDRHGLSPEVQYWNVLHETEEHSRDDLADESYCISTLRRLLRDAVRLRMISDVPFGVLLSGGVDSSLNVALMSELMDRPVQTFSVGFRADGPFNELDQARKVANTFGAHHHELLVTEEMAIKFLPSMVWHLDEPNADPACIPMFFASKMARDSGTFVVQVGEGADEAFCGYQHYLRELRYYQYYYRLPRVAHKILSRSISSFWPNSPIVDYAIRARDRQSPFFYGAMPAYNAKSKGRLLTDNFRNGMLDSDRVPKDFYGREKATLEGISDDHLARMSFYEFKFRLPEMLLMRVDKMSMATSVEARVPFLDHRIVEFALKVPARFKIYRGVTKYVLKRAAEGIIPDEVIYRPKIGLNSPVAQWLRGELSSKFAREIIYSTNSRGTRFFNETFIDNLFEDHIQGRGNHARRIWSLMIFSLWHNRYFGS